MPPLVKNKHSALLLHAVLLQVTEMVEGEMATAAKEVPRFAAGGAAATSSGSSGGSSSAAARIASRRGAGARYSRFEAEVGWEDKEGGCIGLVGQNMMRLAPLHAQKSCLPCNLVVSVCGSPASHQNSSTWCNGPDGAADPAA